MRLARRGTNALIEYIEEQQRANGIPKEQRVVLVGRERAEARTWSDGAAERAIDDDADRGLHASCCSRRSASRSSWRTCGRASAPPRSRPTMTEDPGSAAPPDADDRDRRARRPRLPRRSGRRDRRARDACGDGDRRAFPAAHGPGHRGGRWSSRCSTARCSRGRACSRRCSRSCCSSRCSDSCCRARCPSSSSRIACSSRSCSSAGSRRCWWIIA